jgi:hypothetical protein
MKVFKNMLFGFSTIFVSLKMVLVNPRIIIFSAISTLWAFFASPLLFGLISRYNYLQLPSFIYVFAFSFIGLIIFNFVYLGVAFFQLDTLEYGKPRLSLATCAQLSWQKINLLVYWAFISALIGTVFFHVYNKADVQAGAMTFLFFRTVEFFWWLINFLIIPVLTGHSSIPHAIAWTVRSILSHPTVLIGAGGGFLFLKYGLVRILLYQVIMSTPLILSQMRLLVFNPEEHAFLLFVLIPIIGVLVTVCLSIVLSSVESTIATLLYAKFSHKKQTIAASTFWSLCFVGALTLIMFILGAFLLASSLTLLSAAIPSIKQGIVQVLQYF